MSKSSPLVRSSRHLWWASAGFAVALLGTFLVFMNRSDWWPDENATTEPNLVWVPGGDFWMGADDEDARADETPRHLVRVSGFWMGRHEVTNQEFAAFVKATGHVTDDEKAIDLREMPSTDPEKAVPGGMVFRPPAGEVVLCIGCECTWWKFKPGASWLHPDGPETNIEGQKLHPVVQVSWLDAVAYCRWLSQKTGETYRLPTEAEWEFAARGGLDRKPFVWGDERTPGGKCQANIWQGKFPHENTAEDGYRGTAPVMSYSANGYGLHDMAGNVWEWVEDWYAPDYYSRFPADKILDNPRGPRDIDDIYPEGQVAPAEKVIRGGSYLCSDLYCQGYRPSARMHSGHTTGLVHTGFRYVKVGR